jgi:hypothetical protein
VVFGSYIGLLREKERVAVLGLSILIITARPLFLLTLFGKGEKANLNKAERNELAKFTNLLLKNYCCSND